MGDLTEFSTWPGHPNIFYKVTSGAVAFSVKGETHAAVGLAKKSGADCEHIVIGHNECWVNRSVPPKLEKLQPKKVQGGLEWVKGGDSLPNGALIGGYEKEMLYVIRAKHHAITLAPGKFVPSLGLAIMSWGGEAHIKSDFEVLCGYNCIWVPTIGDILPVGAVVAGYAGQEPLYVGRVVKSGHLLLGKVLMSHKVCYFPYKDREFSKQEYEILVNPEISMDSPNCCDKERLSGESEPYLAYYEHARSSISSDTESE
ncbi:uncharacterized protein LOC112053233 isoform X4 [Bicyclus anynana]|uniref:Uncharacterized protein LOC112053233 isoform X4 n=1 Tax=Bicyclus anynana TaxID=110368 RepID=A0ABM3LJW4_BICAN|nr:uncharacterized protein LOC112053233 isoform X4 [Bicyclus anynana]